MIDGRIATHAQALAATQTSGNVPLSELLATLSARLAATGVPAGDREAAALAYVRGLVDLKAHELAFHDGFAMLTIAFGIGLVTTLVLMRNRISRG